MSEDFVTITVDDRELKAPKGAMLISVTDDAGIHIPRFCYHKKLSVAANCRMCLVDVEKAPKPMPACATPVMEGMVVHTRSPKAIAAQKSVMEFLLINHPLDCPICDQGGECELQDLSMGFGGDSSQYADIKRVVFDKDIGPLVQTELTRCIQCTRCIRFGEEIAGMRELGATDRGERMQIGTFVEKSVDSEMSGNIIDICPVGALTAKPSRFSARSWEMVQHPAIAPHDAVGSNIYVHTFRGKVTRVVPRENEAINEVWISDRDRFSYQGIHAQDRLTTPLIKEDGMWREADWEDALQKAVSGLQSVINSHGADQFGSWVSASATLEELYLLQKVLRGLGSHNIEHRLRQADFSDQHGAPIMPWLGQSVQSLEKLNAALLIGSHVRKEQPLIAHRLRKAAIKNQARISFVNPRAFDWHFPVSQQCVSSGSGMLEDLAAIAKAAYQASSQAVPAHLADVINGAQPEAQHKQIVEELSQAQKSTLLLGNIAHYHPQFAAIRALAAAIAEQTDSLLGYLPDAANTAGAWLAGALPQRGAAGQPLDNSGKTMADMLQQPCRALLTFNVEAEFDTSNGMQALSAVKAAEFVVAISSFVTDSMKEYADVVLPLSAFTETSGTYVNAEGVWQSFKGVTAPLGESRPGWKILRVMGNLFNLEGFDYTSSGDVKQEIKDQCQGIQLSNTLEHAAKVVVEKASAHLQRVGEVPIYAVDALVRRAAALQKTRDAAQDCVRINSRQAEQSGVAGAAKVKVTQDGGHSYLPLLIDEGVPDGCIWVAAGIPASLTLGNIFGPVELEKV
jgi:NADH-quinone oxidoreductase subunit G